MALFNDPQLLKDEKKTRDTLKAAFAKVGNGDTHFLYYEKVQVGSKEVPALAVVDYANDFEGEFKKAYGKSPKARGKCHATAGNELVFGAEQGELKLDALTRFMGSISGIRPVCSAAQEAPAALGSGTGTGTPAPDAKPEAKPDAKADAKAESRPEPGEGGPKQVGAKPDPELVKRLAALTADCKQLPGDLGESYLVQVRKIAEHLQSGDGQRVQTAAKLLDALEPMVQKTKSREAPDVEQAALHQARTAVDTAWKTLPPTPPGLRGDIEATAEGKVWATVAEDATKAKVAVGASRLLVKKIEEFRALALAWPATTKKALEDFDNAFKQARAQFKVGAERLDAHQNDPDALEAKRLCGDPGAYAKEQELAQAMQKQAQALTGLVDSMQRWDTAAVRANTDTKAALANVDASYRPKVEEAMKKDPAFAAVNDLVKRGRGELLAPALLDQPVRDLLDRVAALADEERRRIQAADVKRQLQARRPEVDKAVQDCTDLIARATAALAPLEASWRTVAVQAELTSDGNTVTGWRGDATTLRNDIDSAILALGAEPPPAALVITNAEGLLTAALPDLKATSARVQRNLATTSSDGILKQLETMLQLAITNQHLSNTRVGNLRAALKKAPKTLTLAQQDIDAAVFAQNHPKPGDWLKVLQMPNVKPGGDLRVAGMVGKCELDRKLIDVHMTLYLANVDVHNSPHLGMTARQILDVMLPDRNGNVGTHLTAEVHGEKDKRNPHFFKSGAEGYWVANSLEGHTQEGTFKDAMKAVLKDELDRLEGLVNQHIARHGVWPGE